jgi:hypothetical protein
MVNYDDTLILVFALIDSVINYVNTVIIYVFVLPDSVMN